MEERRNRSAKAVEPASGTLVSMTVQSSFLIRCLLTATGETNPGKVNIYTIQHVQTGAEFRSATLGEITGWMTEQNMQWMAGSLKAAAETLASGAQEGK